MIYANAIPATEVARIRKFREHRAASSARSRRRATRPTSTCAMPRSATAACARRSPIRSTAPSSAATVFPGLSENMVGPVPPTSPLCTTRTLVDYALDPAKANAAARRGGISAARPTARASSCAYVYGAQRPAGGQDLRHHDPQPGGRRHQGDRPAARPRRLDPGGVHQQRIRHDVGVVFARPRSRHRHRALLQFEQHLQHRRRQQQQVRQSRKSTNCSTSSACRPTSPSARRSTTGSQEIVWNDIPVFPFSTYRLPGAFNGEVVSGIYDGEASNREDFAFAQPAKA